MHTSYRRSFGPENVVELSKNITVQHEDYLRQDDRDKKADALRYMAGYAVQYLHLVPQDKKFTFKETERVLHNSAMNIGEFDPREGSLAFTYLAKYAENLLEQPWRKDFHMIKLISGFYVHNIAAQLQNAHEVLIVMGYVNIDDTTLKLIPNHNTSKLKAVSRDCYIASQECLVLSQIWQHVADQEPDYPLTIGEVFEYRKNHLGDTDTICNKLLYDIRQRMHAVKIKQQQQQLINSVPLKPTQRFVPVDRLIDFEDSVNVDEPEMNFVPEREVERVQDMIKNINTFNNYHQPPQHNKLYQDDEHIYDPVYNGDNVANNLPTYLSRPQPDYYLQQQQQQIPNYFFTSRKSLPSNAYGTQPYPNNFNNVMMNSDRNSMSPMIPQTVTSFFSTNNGGRDSVTKSNSMNGINTKAMGSSYYPAVTQPNVTGHPLTLSKVKETDLDAEPVTSPVRRDAFFNNNINIDRSHKPIPPTLPKSSQPVYADEFYPPGIVKPVPVYGSPMNPAPLGGAGAGTQYNSSRLRQNSDNSEEVLNEAYAYASEVNQIPKGNPGRTESQKLYQHQATPIPNQGSDSDSRSLSSSRGASIQRELAPGNNNNSARSGSSTDASSWEGSVVDGSGGAYGRQAVTSKQQNPAKLKKSEPPRRPSHIDIRNNGDTRRSGGLNALSPTSSQIRYADSSPESDLMHAQQQPNNKNGYHELSSSSSGSSSSPASSSFPRNPRAGELNSLDTVYYDYLLKQGDTDHVMNGRGRENEKPQHDKARTVSSSSSRSGSQHHHQKSIEPEENHIYDGRRVVKKKQSREFVADRVENHLKPDVNQHRRKTTSNINHNLSSSPPESSKPVIEKNLKDVNTKPAESRKGRVPDESEIPSYSPKPVEPWDCRFCTFRNLVEDRICEVCAKSKDFFEEEVVDPVQNALAQVQSQEQSKPKSQPQQPSSVRPPYQDQPSHPVPKMYSVPNNTTPAGGGGGIGSSESQQEERECPQCTLLNPIRARVCDACNFRLIPVESSPRNIEELAQLFDKPS